MFSLLLILYVSSCKDEKRRGIQMKKYSLLLVTGCIKAKSRAIIRALWIALLSLMWYV